LGQFAAGRDLLADFHQPEFQRRHYRRALLLAQGLPGFFFNGRASKPPPRFNANSWDSSPMICKTGSHGGCYCGRPPGFCWH